MKKSLFSLLAVLMVATLVLSACAQPAVETPETPVEQPVDQPVEEPVIEEPVVDEPQIDEPIESIWADVTPAPEIVWWHQHTGDAREAALKQIVDGFNDTVGKEHGVHLTAEYSGGYSDIFTKMLALLNTSDVPDIVVAYQNQVATYQLADAMFDMNTIIDDPIYGMPKEDQEDFIPAFFEQDVFPLYGNQRLGLAPNRSMEVMYYNMDWLKELGYDAPPSTPEQFKEMACKAVEQPFSKSKGDTSMGYQLSIDTSRFASWTFAFGGDIYDAESNQYTLNSPAAVEAFEFLQDLFDSGCATLVSENYGDQTDFGNGALLFTIGSSSGLSFYPSVVEEGADFEWSVGALPNVTGTPKQNVYGASVSIPKSTPERELAAWLFLKYYTQPEIQKLWAEASGYYPVRQSAADMMTDYMAANPTFKASWDLLGYGAFEPAVPGYDFVREQVNIVMAALVDNTSLDVTEELTKLNDFGNTSLAEQLEQLN
ncbi:MAG: extracellular solute-binding protein [Anaerolineaceae bacterium]|nr:extracellular solute-binding protein [Anaerolineaceae bacterium]